MDDAGFVKTHNNPFCTLCHRDLLTHYAAVLLCQT